MKWVLSLGERSGLEIKNVGVKSIFKALSLNQINRRVTGEEEKKGQ